MLLRIYRGIGPGTVIVIIITLILVWLKAFLNPVQADLYYNTNPAPLYSLIYGFFEIRPKLGILFSMLLVLIIGTYMVNFNTRLFFINERTFLPASLYVLFSGFISSIQILNPVLPASLMLIIAIDRLIVSYRKPGIAYNLFDSSLIIGLAALLYTNIIWFYLLIIAGISLFRSFNLRELLLSLAGIFTPYIVLFSFYYLSGRDLAGLGNYLLDSLITDVPDFYWSPAFIVVSSINLFILIISLMQLLSIYNTKKVRSRKIFTLFTFMLLLTVIIYFAVPSASVELMYVFLLPLVYILTHYLVMMRNKKIANRFMKLTI